jgi:hypothetical protein
MQGSGWYVLLFDWRFHSQGTLLGLLGCHRSDGIGGHRLTHPDRVVMHGLNHGWWTRATDCWCELEFSSAALIQVSYWKVFLVGRVAELLKSTFSGTLLSGAQR